MVVDSNYLQNDNLAAYLSRSTSHFVVLSDYLHMEAFKGETLQSAFKSMRILSKYPRQVLVLKPTARLASLSGRGNGLQRRLIDSAQTSDFPHWCRELARAERGDPQLEARMIALGKDADAHLNKVQSDMQKYFTPALEAESTRRFSAEELQILRKREGLTEGIVSKLVDGIFELAFFHFDNNKTLQKCPPQHEWHNTYSFRGAICEYLLALYWMSQGGAKGAKPQKLRNDVVDLHFVVCATYFDGLLSEDKKALGLYRDATFVLSEFKKHVDAQIKQPAKGQTPKRIYGIADE
jgi:hypothetical protein